MISYLIPGKDVKASGVLETYDTFLGSTIHESMFFVYPKAGSRRGEISWNYYCLLPTSFFFARQFFGLNRIYCREQGAESESRPELE